MNKIKFMMMAMIAMLTLGFASCSSSSDDSNSPAQPSSKVQSVELRGKFSVSEDLASVFKLTLEWYDEDGNLQSQVLDSEHPINLSVKYDLAKAKVLGCRLTGEYIKNVKIDPDKTYSIEYNFANTGLWYVVNGDSKTITFNDLHVNANQWFKTKQKYQQFFLDARLVGTSNFFYKVTDTGLERVKNN